MQRAYLLLLLIKIANSQHIVNLTISNKKSDWNVDLSFDRLIIPAALLDIKSIKNAKLVNGNFSSHYQGLIYNADIYEIPLTIIDSEKKRYENLIEIDILNFSGFSLNKGVLGLSPESIIKNSIPDIYTLQYKPLKNEFLLIKDEKLSDLKLFKFDKTLNRDKKVFFLDAILKYKLNVQKISLASEAENQAGICFNSLNFEVSDYFFISPNMFYYDWQQFFANFENFPFGKVLIGFTEFDVLSANGQDFRIPYDKTLFEAYSGYPMKSCPNYFNFCEVYIGEFFLKRSGMVLYFQNNEFEIGSELDAFFSLSINPYEFQSKYYFKFFFILALIGSLIAVIFMFFLKRKTKKNERTNNKIYEHLRPENSGL